MLYLFRPFRAQGSSSLLGAPNALGIAAASFARLGLQTSGYGLRYFFEGRKIKASKDIAESPTA